MHTPPPNSPGTSFWGGVSRLLIGPLPSSPVQASPTPPPPLLTVVQGGRSLGTLGRWKALSPRPPELISCNSLPPLRHSPFSS